MQEIRPMMQEMLNLHVEHEEINTLLMERSIRSFITQFDPQKIYLTEEEIHPYLESSNRLLKSAVANYYHDEYGDFISLNRLFHKAMSRAREWREELQREFVIEGEKSRPQSRESYVTFAEDEFQLKERWQKQLAYFTAEERSAKPKRYWTPHIRERLGQLWNKRFVRHEKSYISNKPHHFALHILKSMARSLDAHSSFYGMEEALEMRAALEKQFEGIGVVLIEGVDGVEIADLIEGGPADKSGKVLIGDLIVEINGSNQTGATYEEVLTALQGDTKNSPILLGLKRESDPDIDKILHVELKREKILLSQERVRYEAIPYRDGVIGKIILPSFYESRDGSSCEKDLREAIRKLKKQGNLKGLVIDMRENSGGFLNQAVKVSGLFMSNGVVVISKYAKGEIQYLRTLDGQLYYDGPLLLLTSKLSASATEIVAQALQDYGTAIIVGDERTYGKGTIQFQTITDNHAKAFYKVTVGRYYTVSGESTQITGVKADILLPSPLAAYSIGEKYLDFPLSTDRVAPAYEDSLHDLDEITRAWYQKNYLPHLQKKETHWHALLPELRNRSQARIEISPHAREFFAQLHQIQTSSAPTSTLRNWWNGEDWQLMEALEIVKDMTALHLKRDQ
jgi:carboxyl-terminal processing protease